MRFRGIVVCLVILGALAIGSGYQAIRNIDVNTYRALIASQVETMTGRPVTIAGNVEVSPSLHPSIVIEQVSLANPGWSSRPQMATVKRLELQASLLPLLAGRFEIGRVVLSGVHLLVETDGAGHRNWDFSEQAGPAAAAPAAGGSTAPASLPSIGNIVLEDVAVTIRDGASGRSRSFHIDNLSAKSEAGEDLLTISLDGSLNEQPYLVEGTVGGFARLVSRAPYPIKLAGDIAGASATLRGNIDQSSTPGVQSLDFTLSGRNLADLSKLLATDLPATGSYSLAAVIDDSADSYELRDIALQLGGSDLSGSLTIKPQAPRWRIDGTLHAATLSLDDFRPITAAPANAGAIFPDGALSLALNGDLDGTIRFSADRLVDPALTMSTVLFDLALAEGRVEVSAFQADVAGGWLTGAASVETGAGDPQWRLKLQARQIATADFLRLLSGSSMVSGGRGDFAFDLRSRGRLAAGLLAALNGTASADLTGGRISDDFAKLGLADLPQLVSVTADPDSRRLTCAAVRFAIKDGIVRSNRLVVDTRDAVVVGSGQLDLRRATIAMRFKPAAKQASPAGFSPVSFDVKGPLADPNLQADAPVPTAPENPGIAAVGTGGAVVGTIAAVAAPPAPPVTLPVAEEPVVSCSKGSADALRLPQNTAPTVTLPQNVAPAIGTKRTNFNNQADSSGANHNVGGALTPFGGSLAADDDGVKTQSATNPQ
jgi:uncharacterized protein involved in outer membrane biogenesis